uniref:polymorphic toxin-type HINT domain-containing protein n=1 Tax=Nonomuraea candida TaxID=359159 RepID=UPI0005BDA7E2
TIDPYPSINLNRYTYAAGNPLAYTDPSGNCPFCVPLLFAAVRVAAQIAARALAKQAVKQVIKKTAQQAVKKTTQQAAKKTTQQAAKKTTQQAAKKTTKQTAKKTTQQAAKKTKSTTRKQTARATTKKPTRPVVKTPKVKPPKVRTPKAKTPKAKTPKGKTTKTKTSKSRSSKTKTPSKSRSSKTKTPTKSKNQQRKNEIANEATEMALNEADVASIGGFDLDFGYDGDMFCRSLVSCAKDVVEEITENAADEVIDDLIEDTVPSLPVDPPGSDFSASCALPNSFVAGTPVLMADGSRKPIEQIKAGEEVLATDPATGRTGARPVTTLITSEGAKNLVDITITVDGRSDVLTATDEHPFWLPKRQTWLNAGDLRPGMWLQTSAGTYVQVSAVEHRTATQRVHNLTVEDFHTYHVVAGGQGVLVHNDNPRLSDEECFALADRYRDEELERMSKTQKSKHVMIIGVVDCVTGDWAVGKKRSGAGDYCAETNGTDQLLQRGSQRENLRYGHPMYPNTGNLAPVCKVRCQDNYRESQFPPDVRADPGGAWGRK